jgi:hypothetical protein
VYPVRVDVSLDVPPSRWLWLVTWILLLATGRHPERLYDFVLGLNRWVLRVVRGSVILLASARTTGSGPGRAVRRHAGHAERRTLDRRQN